MMMKKGTILTFLAASVDQTQAWWNNGHMFSKFRYQLANNLAQPPELPTTT